MKELIRFSRYLRGYRSQIVLAAVLILSVTALNLPYPLIVRAMLDDALPHQDWGKQKLLMSIFLGMFLLRGALAYWNRYVLQRLGMRVTCDIRKDIFAHLQTLSMKYYESHQTGKITARVAYDTGALFTLITSEPSFPRRFLTKWMRS